MKRSQRPVDRAMQDERPEKAAIRELWLEAVLNFDQADPNDDVPLYLTLSGARGLDIDLLVQRQVIPTTENGAIPLTHRHRVVAVENNGLAVTALQKRFPGLKILEHPFHNLLRSESPLRWPDGDDERFCCARVVNLDLDASLEARLDASQLAFPVLQWVGKLAQLHATRQLDWTLCLTLHGETPWPHDASVAVQEFLSDNFAHDDVFASASRDLLGEDLFDEIVATKAVDLAKRRSDEQQQVLMVLVPKKIAHLACVQGWRVDTRRNLRYGGIGGRAPMVTWILDFSWDSNASRLPHTVLRDSVRSALSGVGTIEEDGTIS